jgi:hypothetical protein
MITGGHSTFAFGVDFAVLAATLVVLLSVVAKLYPRIIT